MGARRLGVATLAELIEVGPLLGGQLIGGGSPRPLNLGVFGFLHVGGLERLDCPDAISQFGISVAQRQERIAQLRSDLDASIEQGKSAGMSPFRMSHCP